MHLSERQRHAQKALLAWHKKHSRAHLPWRRVRDQQSLYRVMLAEIMLQQTNVPKVIEKYKAFVRQFPTVRVLAVVPQGRVVRAWQGLGYNRRAQNLHKAARAIVAEHGARVPQTEEALLALPGIGPYTARAILVFGRNADLAARDVNVDRVLGRIASHKVKNEEQKEALAQRMLPQGRACVWHEALMDFASTVCTKRTPQCSTCPLQKHCAAYPCTGDVTMRKKEVGRREGAKHVPRRIYRGRIVERLRAGSATTQEIGTAVKADYTHKADQKWLEDLLAILTKEGMIVKRGVQWRLC